MAKDYFQDIVPPSSGGRARRIPVHVEKEPEKDEVDVPKPESADRSIRNVNITPGRPRRVLEAPGNFGAAERRRPRIWLWALGAIVALVVGGIALVALRATTVTVTPRTHAVLFDDSSVFTAYPQIAAPAGALAYTVESVDLEESETVESTGTVQAADKASGTVTVVNEYSTDPVTLVKNTRFATPAGLIFRAPADVLVPGKTASGAGTIQVSVVADQAGAEYNVAPTARFTLPGLKSTADMYAKVYARSSEAFVGGFKGERPGVSPADTDRAIAGMRSRLETKARETALALASDATVVFADLMQIRYEEAPPSGEGSTVRLTQRAHVSIPVFAAEVFAKAVALSVSSDAAESEVALVPGEGYGARLVSASTTLGVDPLRFGLMGAGTIVWKVDRAALADALAGRDQSAFQTIVTGFKGIQEARARIEPFWAGAFPGDPDDIRIKVQNPAQ